MLQNVSDPDVIAAKLVTSTKRSGGGMGTLNLTPVSQPGVTFNDGTANAHDSS